MSGAVLAARSRRFRSAGSDRIDRRYVLIGISAAAIVMSVTISVLNPTTPWVVIALVAGFGGMVYPMYGLAVAHANDYARPTIS